MEDKMFHLEVPEQYEDYRYILSYNEKDDKKLFVICFNPTTFATKYEQKYKERWGMTFEEAKKKHTKSKIKPGVERVLLDNTLKKIVENIVEKKYNNYNSVVFFNLLPGRSDDKGKLDNIGDIEKNAEEIKNYIANYIKISNSEDIDVLCAWGVITDFKKRTIKKNEKCVIGSCIKIYENINKIIKINYKCLKLTQNKHPNHPAYLSFDTFIKWDEIEDYMKRLGEKYKFYENK